MEQLRVRVSGRVQGVGFRWFVREEARRLGLSGWVANQVNGDVHVAAGGEPLSLERLRRALAVGPMGADVLALEELAGDVTAVLPYPFAIHR